MSADEAAAASYENVQEDLLGLFDLDKTNSNPACKRIECPFCTFPATSGTMIRRKL